MLHFSEENHKRFSFRKRVLAVIDHLEFVWFRFIEWFFSAWNVFSRPEAHTFLSKLISKRGDILCCYETARMCMTGA